MKYSAVYLDRYFDSLSTYTSKVELLNLTQSNRAVREKSAWMVGVGELMNWQAMSERSGVWTYYESVDPAYAEAAANWLNNCRPGDEGFAWFALGIGCWEDQALMHRIDEWIESSGLAIERLVEETFLKHRRWFYEELET